MTHRRLVRPQFRDERSELYAPQNRTQNRMPESQALYILQKHYNKVKDDNKNLKNENGKIKVRIWKGFLRTHPDGFRGVHVFRVIIYDS